MQKKLDFLQDKLNFLIGKELALKEEDIVDISNELDELIEYFNYSFDPFL